jgi:hypothetical protein
MMNNIWDFKVVIASFSLYMNKIDVQDYDLYNLISSISKRKRTQSSSAVVSLDAQKNPRKGKGNPPATIDQPKIERERERRKPKPASIVFDSDVQNHLMREETSNSSSHNGSTPSGKCKLQTSNTENGKYSMKFSKNEFRVHNNNQ